MAKYTYLKARYGQELTEEFDTLEEALEEAWCDNEYGGAWPIEILEDEAVLWSNRGGHPLVNGSTPLLDRLYQWEGERK